MISFEWRGSFDNTELNELHAEGFAHGVDAYDWWRQVHRHSLGWVCARDGDRALVGFVNVAWDGGSHAFILDTLVAGGSRRRGIGAELVRVAAAHAGEARCEWLHVDFDDHLRDFYHKACGFTETNAGLIRLDR